MVPAGLTPATGRARRQATIGPAPWASNPWLHHGSTCARPASLRLSRETGALCSNRRAHQPAQELRPLPQALQRISPAPAEAGRAVPHSHRFCGVSGGWPDQKSAGPGRGWTAFPPKGVQETGTASALDAKGHGAAPRLSGRHRCAATPVAVSHALLAAPARTEVARRGSDTATELQFGDCAPKERIPARHPLCRIRALFNDTLPDPVRAAAHRADGLQPAVSLVQGPGVDNAVRVPTVFTKNRDRLLITEVYRWVMAAILAHRDVETQLSGRSLPRRWHLGEGPGHR